MADHSPIQYFQHAHFIPIMDVGAERRTSIDGDAKAAHVTRTTLLIDKLIEFSHNKLM